MVRQPSVPIPEGLEAGERINQFKLYELARELRPLMDLGEEIPRQSLMLRLYSAKGVIEPFLSDNPPVRLKLALDVLRKLHDEIEKLQTAPPKAAGPTLGGLAAGLVNADDQKVPGWHTVRVYHALRKFEAVLETECTVNAAFVAPKRGVFDTEDLVNAARRMIPDALKPAISALALEDLDSAGRCLAFGLYTASGFHACRAVEGVMEDYYRRFCGSTKTLKSWNDYITALDAALKGGASPLPEASTIAHLNTMRKYNRNEIAHPRVVLDEAEADTVLTLGKAVICCMAKELLAAGAASVPATLPTSPQGSPGATP